MRQQAAGVGSVQRLRMHAPVPPLGASTRSPLGPCGEVHSFRRTSGGGTQSGRERRGSAQSPTRPPLCSEAVTIALSDAIGARVSTRVRSAGNTPAEAPHPTPRRPAQPSQAQRSDRCCCKSCVRSAGGVSPVVRGTVARSQEAHLCPCRRWPIYGCPPAACWCPTSKGTGASVELGL